MPEPLESPPVAGTRWSAETLESMSTLTVAPSGYQEAASVGPVIELAQVVIEERDAELAALRERLAYYEGFDALINDNVARSAELIRSVGEERERLRSQAIQWRLETESRMTEEVERYLAGERERTHAILTALMEDATRMQRQIDGLIQRLSQAITETAVTHGARSAH